MAGSIDACALPTDHASAGKKGYLLAYALGAAPDASYVKAGMLVFTVYMRDKRYKRLQQR